jgi:hypothetical protein
VVLPGQEVVVMPLSSELLPDSIGRPAGVIGADILSRFVTEIDYRNGSVSFRDPGQFVYQGAGAELPFFPVGYLHGAFLRVDGVHEGAFGLDLGVLGTRLNASFVADHEIAPAEGRGVVDSSGTLLRMKRLEIGPYGWNDPLVHLGRDRPNELWRRDYAGDIGNAVLSRFRVTLDYRHRRLYLEPDSSNATRDAYSPLGADFVRQEERLTLRTLVRGSTAERFGIRDGDEVTAINGKPAAQWSAEDITRLLDESEVRRLRLDIKRDGRGMTIEAALGNRP